MKLNLKVPLVAFAMLASASCTKNLNSTPVEETLYNEMDKTFLTQASYGNNAEVDAGNMAAFKSTDSSVKAFAIMMVNDHQAAQQELNTIAGRLSFTTPKDLDPEHQMLKQMLTDSNGRSFDSLYIHSQVKDHQKTVALFESEIATGKYPQLKDYASKHLPYIRMHLQMADSIARRY